MTTTHSERQAAVAQEAATFPPAFGLRAFPGQTFRVNTRYSFHDRVDGVQLVVEVKSDRDHGRWHHFSRDTPAAIRRELVEAPK